MTKIMPISKQQLRYQWIQPILEKQLSIKDVCKVCPFAERTIKYWLARYRVHGLAGLIDYSMIPHHQPNKTPQWIVDRILAIKEEKRVGAKKIMWDLENKHILIGEATVNRILKKAGKTRIYRRKRDYILRKEPITIPGKVLEIDIKYAIDFGFNRWWYQYTAIDCASKWRYLYGYENRENDYSIDFLDRLVKRSKKLFRIQGAKTDNDAVFTNRITGYSKSEDPLNPRLHDFDIKCKQYGITHYLIVPGKPTQNGTVERSHRTDNEYFYSTLSRPASIEEFNYKLRLWNNWYNDLPHCSLNGLSPNEYLRRVQKVMI